MQGVDLSPIGLFLGASLVGKAVMAVLFLASLWCWVLIIEGAISVVRLRRAVRQARAGGPLAKSLLPASPPRAMRKRAAAFRARRSANCGRASRTRWRGPRANS